MNLRVRALVVDDEAPARAALCRLLAGDPEVEVVGACANGAEALATLRQRPVDVVFLDVKMPEIDGFELVRITGRETPKVVFVTAHAEHALEAFDVEAVDFLLKPFDDERFERALGRAKAAIRTDCSLEGRDPSRRLRSGFLERLTVPTRDGLQVLSVQAIDWFGAQDYYVEAHAGGRSYLLRKSLRRLDRELDPRHFARVHRSAIVNIDRIRTLEPATHGERDLVLHDGTRLHLSRVYRTRLARLLDLV